LAGCPAASELPDSGNAERSGPLEEYAKAQTMADFLSLVMLICASAGAMAFSLLVAYGILRVGFALIHRQSRPAAIKVRHEAAPAS
jgi:hypothetical protein